MTAVGEVFGVRYVFVCDRGFTHADMSCPRLGGRFVSVEEMEHIGAMACGCADEGDGRTAADAFFRECTTKKDAAEARVAHERSMRARFRGKVKTEPVRRPRKKRAARKTGWALVLECAGQIVRELWRMSK